MSTPVTPESMIRFGEFAVDLEAGELHRGGVRVKLQGQPFEVLALLVQRHGRIVTREELRRLLWPTDTFVDFEHGLNAAVNRLREALGDSAEEPRYIETVPRRGYRFIASVETAAAGVPNAKERWHLRVYSRGWKLGSVIASLVLVLAVAFGMVSRYFGHKPGPVAASSAIIKIFPLTGATGAERQPVFSPDGTRIAYLWQDEGQRNSNLYVKLIGAGQPLRLTSNTEEESCPAWSPDGVHIAFLRRTLNYRNGRTTSGSDIYIVAALGGGLARRLTNADSNYTAPSACLSWSPDGRLLATVDKDSPNEPLSIFLVNVEDGKKWKVTSPPANFEDRQPVFSPDGQSLAFVRGSDLSGGGGYWGSDNDIFLRDLTDDARPRTPPRRLTFDKAWVAGLDWTADGRSIVFSSIRSGSPQLWRIEISPEKKEPQMIPAGDDAIFPSVARKGGRLAYERKKETLVISQLEISSSGHGFAPTRFCPSSRTEGMPQFSPDGSTVVFGSDRSGSIELWLCNSDGSSPRQLTSSDGGMAGSPTWSPDGQKVAFDYAQGGHAEIRVVKLDQGPPQRITLGDSRVARPTWSNDGKWIYFGSDATGDWQVWKTPAQGGTPSQVTRHGGWEGRESPDGKYVYYVKYHVPWEINPPRNPGIWRIPSGGGEETRLLEYGESGLWTVTPRGIYLFNPLPSGPTLEFFKFATQRISRIAVIPEVDTYNPALTVSPDGRKILYGHQTDAGSIMVIENFR